MRTFRKYRIGASSTSIGREEPASETPRSTWNQWVWPVPVYHGHFPTVSDGFGRNKRGGRGHFGVDIMHRRKPGHNLPEYIAPDGGRSEGYVIFLGEPVIAAGPGRVFDAENSATGHVVRISHRVNGRPILSVYRHLQNVAAGIVPGRIVQGGEVLGLVGDNPSDKGDPPHLHFELWDTSTGTKYPDWNLNPMSVMGTWSAWLDGARVPHTGDKGDRGERGDTPTNGGGGGKFAAGAAIAAVVGIGLSLLMGRKGARV